MYWNFTEILRTSRDAPLSGRDGVLLVEIGFGNGEFLEHLARTRPDALVVGIEVSQWCLCKAARRALAAGLGNIRLLHGDARALLRCAFEPESVAEAYMNFPCPWPKRRHAERRVARPQFAGLMSGCLARGGSFTLATDVGWYAEQTREVFASDVRFETAAVTKNPDREYHTKYERKWLEMGRDTYMVTARKIDGGAAMEHSREDGADRDEFEINVNTGASDVRAAVLSLKGETLDAPDYHVVFREIFFAEDGSALITTISADEGFEQHFHLRLIPTAGGLRGKVDSVGHPYRTPGVRASLRHVMKKLGARF